MANSYKASMGDPAMEQPYQDWRSLCYVHAPQCYAETLRGRGANAQEEMLHQIRRRPYGSV